MSTLLLATILLPLAAAALPGLRAPMRWVALGATLLSLAGSLVLAASYPAGEPAFAATDAAWLASAGVPMNVRLSIALDGLSLWLVPLTALLMVVAVLVSWEAIRERPSLYYRLLLVLGSGMLGVFVARDIILFYLFFEFTLVPLFFLIGIWGSDQRRHAAIKFFLFTLAGSVLTLVGLLVVVFWAADVGRVGQVANLPVASEVAANSADWQSAPRPAGVTFSIPELTRRLAEHPMPPMMQVAVFLALFAGFAIKVPLFPLHTWLPLAHVEAPAAGSILLAGVLLKIGTYGFVRFSLPMLPLATAVCMPWMLGLAVAGILYGALVALAQSDLKRLIAYSSVSHMGFCMLGIFALNNLGLEGGVLQMINHGLSTGGLFALVGMLYERYHTRRIAELGGIAREVPRLTFFMVFMALASIGLPGLNGFVGELLVLLGMFQRGFGSGPPVDAWTWLYRALAVLATSGVVLGAWYMLWLVQRVFFGPPQKSKREHAIRDLSGREIAALAPLAVVIVWIGVQPRLFLDRMAPTLRELSAPARQAAGHSLVPTLCVGTHGPAAPRPCATQSVAASAFPRGTVGTRTEAGSTGGAPSPQPSPGGRGGRNTGGRP